MNATEENRTDADSRVEVYDRNGEWIVLVIEDGIERETSYALKRFADSFAAGQRLRLRLPSH